MKNNFERVTVYLLKNQSASEGTYLYNNDYHSLASGGEIELSSEPTSMTANISLTVFRKKVMPKKEIKPADNKLNDNKDLKDVPKNVNENKPKEPAAGSQLPLLQPQNP